MAESIGVCRRAVEAQGGFTTRLTVGLDPPRSSHCNEPGGARGGAPIADAVHGGTVQQLSLSPQVLPQVGRRGRRALGEEDTAEGSESRRLDRHAGGTTRWIERLRAGRRSNADRCRRFIIRSSPPRARGNASIRRLTWRPRVHVGRCFMLPLAWSAEVAARLPREWAREMQMTSLRPWIPVIALVALVSPAACVQPPAALIIPVAPGPHKSFDAFGADHMFCQQYAAAHTGAGGRRGQQSSGGDRSSYHGARSGSRRRRRWRRLARQCRTRRWNWRRLRRRLRHAR